MKNKIGDEVDMRVRTALTDLHIARKEFMTAVGMTGTNSLPAPASEENIMQLEKTIGRSIPPSYRSFLRIHDGFPEMDGEVNLLRVADMISFFTMGAADLLRKIAEATSKDFIQRCIVFGTSSLSTSAYLFDPEEQQSKGEWAVIEFDEEEGIESVHVNFLAFLEKSVEEVRDAKRETLQGNDILDLDI